MQFTQVLFESLSLDSGSYLGATSSFGSLSHEICEGFGAAAIGYNIEQLRIKHRMG